MRYYQPPERPRAKASRIHGCRRILAELRRLRIKVGRAQGVRDRTPEEAQWLRSVADALDKLILAGDAVLPGFADPRDQHRGQKTRLKASTIVSPEDRWADGLYEH